MAEAQANINLNLNTSGALAQLRALQRQISLFQQQMARGNANTVAQAQGMQRNLLNSINSTGQFAASMTTVSTATESFTSALQKNKLSMGEYFRFAGGASKNFGRFFRNEMNLVGKVARERVKDLQTQYIKMGRDTNGAMRAMAVRPLTLDMENLATRTAMAAQKQQIFNQLIRQGSTNLLNWGKNTQWAGRQLMVGFTIPLGIMGATAISEFRKLEEQAVKFRRVYGDMFTTSAETEKALDNVRELADEFTKYGIAVEKTIDLAAKVAQMGNMGDALEQQVTQATRLAVLGGLEQQEALDTTISLTNAFGVATEDLASKIAFLNAAENQTILAIEDFNEAIPKAGSVVQQLGGDVEDLAFFLTAMREGGINASQGANALKSSLGRLVNPTEVARKKMAELGIDIVGIVENNVGDLRGTIMELGYELDALAPLDRSRAIEQMFGKFQFARMSTMFQNIVKDGSQAQKVLELTTNSSEELAILAERELARVEESPAFKLQKSFEKLKASLAPLGEQFVKIVTPIIEFGTNILEKFNAMGEGGKRFATIAIASLGLVAPAALMIIGLIANGVANLAKFFTMLMSVGKQGSTSMTQLGAQTQYMTQEQIEASAVAASLNNSHERLRQTFTSEAAAVRSLTTAYQQGIGAQRAFAFGPGRGPARGKTASGFAEGVVSVPGPKGAGDIIPAMLSPGEAVIPRKMVDQYEPLIAGMISGDIPGYVDGGIVKAGSVAFGPEIGYSELSLLAPGNESAAGIDMSWLQGGGADVAASVEGSFLSDPSLGISADKVGPLADEFADELAKAASETGDFNAAAEKAYPRLTNTIDDWEKEGKLSAKEAKKLRRQTQKLLKPTKADLKERRRQRADLGIDKDGRPVARRTSTGTIRGGEYRRRVIASTQEARARRGLEPAPVGRGVNKYQAAHTQPGKVVGPSLPPAPSKNVPTAMIPAVTAAGMASTTGKQFKESLAAERNSVAAQKESTEATKKNTRAKKKDTDTTQKQTAAKQRSIKQTQRDPATGRLVSKNRDLSGVSRLTSRQPVLAYAGGMPETSPAPAAPGRFKRFMSVGRGSGGMGIAMGASALAMGGSMLPGQIGQTVQKLMPAIMGISMLAPMIGMLGAPLTALIAVVGGLTAAYFLHKKAIEDTAKETYELQRALGTSRTAVQSLAEEAGRVTDRELVERQQQDRFDPFQIAAGKTTFGENFAEGEAGQELVSNIRTSLTDLGRDQTVTSVFQQLGQAVGEGALSIPEARSIATELGDQIDDMSFGMEVNANLMRLLGPGGEDLTAGDRLTILADLREDRQRTRSEMDLSYDPGGYFDFEMGDITDDIVESGIGYFNFENIKLAWANLFNIPQGKRSVKEMSTILAQGVNDADAYASEMSAIEITYSTGLEKAYAIGDQYEISRLEKEKGDAQRELIKTRRKNQEQILTELSKDIPKAQLAMKQALEVDFADDEAALAQYQGALKQIRDLGLSDQKSLQLEYMLTSGDMEFSTAMAIVENYEKLPRVSNKILKIQTELGGDFGKNASDLFNIFNDLDEALAEDFVLSLDTENLDEYQKQIEGFGAISRVTNLFPEGEEILLDLALKDPSVLDGIVERTSRIEALDNEQITLDFIANTFGDEALAAAETIWSTIPKEDRKDALYSILTALDLQMGEGFDDLFSSLEGQTIAGVTISEPGDILSLIGARTSGIAQGNREAGDGEEEIEAAGGSAKKLTSIMDDLVKKLRDVRLSTILMTNGWVESANKLEELFGGGRGISVFRGLEQEMRSLGAGEDLIDLIVGMDPEEFEKKKDQLFTFDAAGNITGATNILANMGKALDAIALGDFQSEQEKIVRTISDQIIATRKLTAAGFSQVEAYEAVQDAAFAAAVAQEKSKDVIRQLVNVTKEAKEMTEAFAAAQAVASSNQEFVDRGKAIDFIAKNIENLTEAQKQLIMSDSNVQALIGTTVDAKALRQALANAEKEAQLELRIKKLTFEGQIDIFEEGFSNAMEAFAVQEKEIELDFKIKKQPLIDAIGAAERQIQDIRDRPGGLDDLEADLSRISDKEKELNKRYDERIKALEEVKSINKAVAKLQQSQLDVAEALSRGDIAAAAKAAQQRRQQSASMAVENQSKQIELQRETELANLTAKNGLNRKQLEESIKTLKDEIFEIEERTIEPAQYRLELLEREQQELIDGVTVLGKTRDEWERIKNNIDLAKISSDSFQQTMQEALDIVDSIVNYWNDFDPDPKEIQITEKIVEEREPLEPVATVEPKETGDGTGGGNTEDKDTTEVSQEASALAQQKAARQRLGAGPEDSIIGGKVVGPSGSPAGETVEEMNRLSPRFKDPGNRSIGSGGLGNMSAQELRENLNTPLGILRPEEFGPGTGFTFADEYRALLEENYKQEGLDFDKALEGKAPRERLSGTAYRDVRDEPTGNFATIEESFTSLFDKMERVSKSSIGGVIADHFRDLGVKTPMLLKTIPDFFNKIPERVRASIQTETAAHFTALSINVPNALQTIPNFFNTIPLTTQQAILNSDGVRGHFASLGETVPEDLSNISSWFFELPVSVQEQVAPLLGQELKNVGVLAEQDLENTIGQYFEFLPENVRASIEGQLGSQIRKEAEAANMSLEDYIGKYFEELPEDIRSDIEAAVTGNFEAASNKAAGAFANPENALKNIGVNAKEEMVGGIVSAATTAANEAMVALAAVDDSIANIPNNPLVSKALLGGIPELVSTGAKTSVENLKVIDEKIIGIPEDTEVKRAVTSKSLGLPKVFKDGGESSGEEFSTKATDKITEAIDDYDPPTITIDIEFDENDPPPGWKFEANNGGMVPYNRGGLAMYNDGGFSMPSGTIVPGFGNYDKVPSLLTPGEFVVRKEAVEKYGRGFFSQLNNTVFDRKPNVPIRSLSAPKFRMSNSEMSSFESDKKASDISYNNSYQINVNVKSDANPEDIARTVVQNIKRVDSQRVRGNRV